MIDLRKIFQKGEGDPLAALNPSLQPTEGLEAEFHAIVAGQLVRGGVAADVVDIDIRPTGGSKEGRPVFCAMVRIKAWEERSVLRLLVGLPLLQGRMKRLIRASWLHDVASFGGIWLHASGQLQDREALRSLRDVLIELESRGTQAPPAESLWSVRDLDA